MAVPNFVELDGQVLLAQNIASFESILGRTLQPAQAESMIVRSFTEIQLRTHFQVQAACAQMLVAYATAPAIDELGKLVGVTRLSASGAVVTLTFSIVAGHGGVVIPAGTRVGTTDGKVIFSVITNTSVAIGTTSKNVECIAQNIGLVGNGYAAGTITQILDPLAFVTAVTNAATSSGGADTETDDELRDRIILAPSQFSVAGPRDAYKYFARTASSAIIDVAVAQTTPGTVGVYPLVAGGTTPSEILALVDAALNDDSVRPLTDTVVVAAPTVVNYNLNVNIVTYLNADVTLVGTQVRAALAEYAAAKATTMGQDIILSQIIAKAASVAGVYKITVVSPSADLILAFNEIAIVGTITGTVTGQNEG
jgi:phage-related baseplate assembly protein